jgi:hypothetical protein
MRYQNTTKFILPIGGRDTLKPYGISREFTDKQVADNTELQSRLLSGHIVEYKGPVAAIVAPKKQDIRYEVDPSSVNGKLITGTGAGAKKPVQYVVADSEGSDGVSMDTEGSVHSLGKDYKKAPDYIEEGVDARTYKKNGADAMEGELNKEFEESTFDDEDTLSENESERDDAQDADAAIAADATQFLHKQGKDGSQPTTAKALIEKAVTSEMAHLNQATAKSNDAGETAPGATGKVADFLKQPLNAKKFMIAKETDSTFLKEVDTLSQSETVKQLVKQRLEEIK